MIRLRHSRLAAPAACFCILGLGCATTGDTRQTSISYPQTRQGAIVEDHHGTQVADPYRWLEDLDSQETAAWVEAQNKVTFGYLAGIKQRDGIRDRLTELWNYEKYGTPSKHGGRYIFTKNDGLQNQNVYYTARSLDDEPRVLIDPNKLSEDGTVSVSGVRISEDGRFMAYGLSASGSDWQTWHVRNIETGEDLPDKVEWIKFSSASWTHDGAGFFYSRYDEPKGANKLAAVNEYQKLYYHRLGTAQAEDELIYERPDEKNWGFGASVTEDGRYAVITVWKGTHREYMIFYKDLADPNGKVIELIDKFEAEYDFIGNDGTEFWFRTDLDAPLGRVIAIDISKPERRYWQEIIPQAENALQSVSVVGDTFIASYLENAHTVVRTFDLSGAHVRDIPLPGIGSASGFAGRRDHKETFYSFTGFTTPTTVYRYDMITGESTIYRQPKVDFDPGLYETKQVFYLSKDETRIPMFITHKKGLKLNGANPTYLYGYGGFNISIKPRFSVSNLVWMEMGGVYAVANIRGGGEYGKAWHEGGMKLTKQNCFDDFIAAAKWLIENDYTSSPKLAIAGASNGGLLVAACITQRPDLFGAALPAVGVLDMLRFHKFTIGRAWTSDYGSPDDAEEFAALYAYSPLHNLRAGTAYPATMITTADHDDRVWPGHSFKFAAAIQAAQTGDAPVLIRIEAKAGHGAGKPTSKRIEEAADRWAFLVRNLNMNPAGF